MEDDKKSPLKGLLKARNRQLASRSQAPKPPPLPARPPPLPQKVAQPKVEKPVEVREETMSSQEVDLSELESNEKQVKPLVRIPDKEIEKSTMELLRFVLKKDKSLLGIFRGKHLGMNEKQNIIIGEKEIGKFMGDSTRIYFHKLWQGNVHGRLDLFTENKLFTMVSKDKCVFFVVEKDNIYLAYSDKEDGKEAPLKMAI